MLTFNRSEHLSIGAELELLLVDTSTYDLKPISNKVIERVANPERVKSKVFLSTIELATQMHRTAHQIRDELETSVKDLTNICGELGAKVCGMGAHPFALYTDRVIFPSGHFASITDRNKWIAKRLSMFGLNIHIGMKDTTSAVQFINALHHYMPMLLSLSANSPYWHSDDTGLASSRISFFEATPTGGHASTFSDWDDFETLHDTLVKCESIKTFEDLWWDIRPNPTRGSVEIRICDIPSTRKEVIAIMALVHSLCHWLEEKFKAGVILPPKEWIIRENKWRASRYGLEANFILDDRPTLKSARAMVHELFSILQPISDRLNYRSELDYLKHMVQNGVGYERQRRAYQKSNFLGAVIKQSIEEFASNTPVWT
jgi:carboxylate-amine ligase